MDLALNNLQRLICHKTQQTKPNQTKEYLKAKLKSSKGDEVWDADPCNKIVFIDETKMESAF